MYTLLIHVPFFAMSTEKYTSHTIFLSVTFGENSNLNLCTLWLTVTLIKVSHKDRYQEQFSPM